MTGYFDGAWAAILICMWIGAPLWRIAKALESLERLAKGGKG